VCNAKTGCNSDDETRGNIVPAAGGDFIIPVRYAGCGAHLYDDPVPPPEAR
jgi:hypothetical protein